MAALLLLIQHNREYGTHGASDHIFAICQLLLLFAAAMRACRRCCHYFHGCHVIITRCRFAAYAATLLVAAISIRVPHAMLSCDLPYAGSAMPHAALPDMLSHFRAAVCHCCYAYRHATSHNMSRSLFTLLLHITLRLLFVIIDCYADARHCFFFHAAVIDDADAFSLRRRFSLAAISLRALRLFSDTPALYAATLRC